MTTFYNDLQGKREVVNDIDQRKVHTTLMETKLCF